MSAAEHPSHVLVVGGGITGLSAAYRLTRGGEVGVTVVESTARLGGKVRTEHLDGFVVDAGPESIAPGRPDALALADELGVELVPAATAAPGAVLVAGRRMRTMPEGIGGFLPRKILPLATTRLFSPFGKLRMAWEIAVPTRDVDSDESLGAFTRRRLGGQAYDRLVEPVASGIFCGDPDRLSILATMPHLKRAEREHGGLLRAVLAEKKAARAAQRATATGAPAPVRRGIMSPRAGMGEIVDRLVAELAASGAELLTSTRLIGLDRIDGRWCATLARADASTEQVLADAVVLAAPTAVTADVADLLGAHGSAQALRNVPVSSVTIVSLGFASDDLPSLDDQLPAHGYLVSSPGHGSVRQVTRSSSKFPGRAPEGSELFRVALRPTRWMDDDALVEAARDELRATLGIVTAPVLVHVQRWDGVMPQYPVGHLDLVAEVERQLGDRPGVVVAGSGMHGLGIPDCVASANRAAARLSTLLAEAPASA
jgi:oxygen-dependent protoporphyrinogen oxidase